MRPDSSPALFFFDVTYFNGPPDTYQIPLAIGTGADLDAVMAEHPESIIAKMTTAAGPAAVYDATVREDFHQELLRLIAKKRNAARLRDRRVGYGTQRRNANPAALRTQPAEFSPRQAPEFPSCSSPAPLSAQPGEAAAPPRTDAPARSRPAGSDYSRANRLPPAMCFRRAAGSTHGRRTPFRLSWRRRGCPRGVSSAEQSNTSIRFDDRLFLKLFRRLQAEENPDVEMGRFLTEIANFHEDSAVPGRDRHELAGLAKDYGGDAPGAGSESGRRLAVVPQRAV